MTQPAEKQLTPKLTPTARARLMRSATYASVAVASFLILVKVIGWYYTGSVSILASLLDSAMDALASLINLFAVRYALSPPDAEHRFGHGKAEPLASLAQSLVIAASAMMLAGHAFLQLGTAPTLQAPGVGAVVMVTSLLATFGLITYQRYVIRMTESTAIQADALHYLGDLLTQGAALVVTLLALAGWGNVDPYIALLIAAYIFYNACDIARISLHNLMDSELPPETRNHIKALITQHAEVAGFHELKTRRSGPTLFIQLHLELDDNMPLIQAHRISDEVEASLIKAYPHAEVLIHQDPVSQYLDHDQDHEQNSGKS
jgi:ferrous-iron efflux pump FieF